MTEHKEKIENTNSKSSVNREFISDNACKILDFVTVNISYPTHLILLKSARYHINEYQKELTKTKVGIDALIQIRKQNNEPPVPEDSKLSWILQRKCDDLSVILKKLDVLISAYDQITDMISEIHEVRHVPDSDERRILNM